MDDLINAGVVGLIEAYHNFDTGKGVKFETYASLRVRGSILDELRGMDWVPRSTRARSREIERAISRLENELGRSPTEAELASGLGVEMSEYYSMIEDISSTSLLSLDDVADGDHAVDKPHRQPQDLSPQRRPTHIHRSGAYGQDSQAGQLRLLRFPQGNRHR